MDRVPEPGDAVPPSVGAALARAMEDDGVDVADRDAVGRWMEAFIAQPYDERAAVLSDEVLGGAAAFDADVPMPTDDDARTSACASPLLVQIRLLVDFVGGGTKLTRTPRT